MNRYGGKLIYETRDDFGIVEVVDRPKIRALHFGTSTEQSSMYIEQPFALEMEYIRTMALGALLRPHAKKALCLGMGGGALPKYLWKYLPECCVTVLELSPAVIDVAHRFFHVPQDSRMSVISADAIQYLRAHRDQEDDLIFVDLYVSGGIAPAVAEPDFFARCDDRLLPGGILVWNMWRSTNKDVLERCLRNLCDVFGRNMLTLPNKESSNFVLLVFKEPIEPLTRKHIDKEAKHFKDLSQVDFPLLLQDLDHFKGYGYLYQDL